MADWFMDGLIAERSKQGHSSMLNKFLRVITGKQKE